MAELERRIRLSRYGRNQAPCIPPEIEAEGDEATLRKEGDCVIVKPVRKGRLFAPLSILEPLDKDLAALGDAEP